MVTPCRCPHCLAPLSKRHVLRSGPGSLAACTACGGRYFGGGLTAALIWLCASAYLTVICFTIGGYSPWALGWLAVGAIASIVCMHRAAPLPASAQWRETAKLLLIPGGLWLVMAVTAHAATWVAEALTAR